MECTREEVAAALREKLKTGFLRPDFDNIVLMAKLTTCAMIVALCGAIFGAGVVYLHYQLSQPAHTHHNT